MDNIIATESGGSWLVPTDQCPQGGCKNIQWEQVTGPDRQPMMQFTILGNSEGWIGMALSSDEMMVGGFQTVTMIVRPVVTSVQKD